MGHQSEYLSELRERAVRMVAGVRSGYPSERAAINAVASKLGIGTAETLSKRVRQEQVDAGQRPGTTSEASEELARLRRENAELRWANEILKAASAFFASSSTGPLCDRDVRPSARRSHGWRAAVGRRSARCARTTTASTEHGKSSWPSTAEVSRSPAAPSSGSCASSARKACAAGGRQRTTVADLATARAADLVARRFDPPAPDKTWVADFTHVPTWAGAVNVAFVIDAYARRILGCWAATSMRTDLVLDALEHARWTRRQQGADRPAGLVHHSDAGSQTGFNWSSQHLDRVHLSGSTGTTTSLAPGLRRSEPLDVLDIPEQFTDAVRRRTDSAVSGAPGNTELVCRTSSPSRSSAGPSTGHADRTPP